MGSALLKSHLEVAAIAAAGIPLTDEQATLYLQLRPGTLAVMRCQGRGPRCANYAGTRPRYLKADLDAWLALGAKRRVSPNVGRPPGSKNRRAVR